MTIVGINFAKMSVEKLKVAKGKINISNNVSIKTVEKMNFSLGSSDQKGARFVFEFHSKYEPEVAEIELIGDVLYVDSEEKIKTVLEEWDKSKTIGKELMTQILNGVLSKCNVQALILSQNLNLPSPIPLPKVTSELAKSAAPKKEE